MAKRYFGSAHKVVRDEATNPEHVEVSDWDAFSRGIHHRWVDDGDFTPGVDTHCDALVTSGECYVRLHSASRH